MELDPAGQWAAAPGWRQRLRAGGSSPVNHETGSFNLHSFALQDVFFSRGAFKVCLGSVCPLLDELGSVRGVCVFTCVL